ncbi:hypothetical protein [Deinococcus aestuarii]|uniref:hypothetical protein n=1 Tax=Deinococcus aestuarii TaxID=2774531 RepID=UPI001C0C3501|nr:hypothetical protein [Deinococcus aestuarii]
MTTSTGKPTVDDLLSTLRFSEPADWLHFERDRSHTYSLDPALTLHEEREDAFHASWLSNFPDPSGTKVMVTVRYGGSLIGEFVFVEVDGGRATLPLPSQGSLLTITYLQRRIGEIINHSAGRPESYAEALDKLGVHMISGG